MNQIKCPHCGEIFTVDESDYIQIVNQIRDKEFEKEISRRKEDLENQKKSDLEILKVKQEKEIKELNLKKAEELSQKDLLIEQLKSQIKNNESETKLAVEQALSVKEKELSEKQSEITKLQSELREKDTEKQLAVNKAVNEKENEITELKGKLEIKESEKALSEKSLKEQYEIKLKAKDDLVEYYKDLKARMSTKMIGETLEQHCLTSFNQVRMAAFPNAYFEKDNDARTGSKGDFIFREFVDGDKDNELISIMFEMKNEADETATKHKNEDFFKELDKDRREKKCEYAVLVSMLESDSEYYNAGIVDVSYKYEKMYVIRPQFFIPMITLLRNAALKSVDDKRKLAVMKNEQHDFIEFENQMNEFKDKFGRNYRLASEQFKNAIDEIDKTIAHLEKVKKALTSSENNLRLANDKAENLSIKALTVNSPSIKDKFDELHKI